MKTISLDDCPRAGKNDLTRVDEGYIDTDLIINLQTSIQNQNLFEENPTGRMTGKQFSDLTISLQNGWNELEPVCIQVEHDGSAVLHEGNHRLHAAHAAGIKAFVEIRYFGNGQTKSALATLADNR